MTKDKRIVKAWCEKHNVCLYKDDETCWACRKNLPKPNPVILNDKCKVKLIKTM